MPLAIPKPKLAGLTGVNLGLVIATHCPAPFPGSLHSEAVAQGEADHKQEPNADELLEGADELQP